jgi:membrane protein
MRRDLRRTARRCRDGISGLRRVHAVDLLVRAGHDFGQHHGSIYAAAISYYAMFSLAPLLIVLAAVFTWVSRGTDLQARLIDLIVGQFPPGANLRPQIEALIKGAAQTSTGPVGVLALVGAAWTASGVFGALRRALNLAFDVPLARSYIAGRLADLLAVALVSLLVLFSLAATIGLGVLRAASRQLFRGPLPNLLWALVFFLLPLAISYAVFLLVYRLIPNLQMPFRFVRIAAFLAAVGFEVVKIGFTIYLANFGHFQRVYGALGGAVVFLFFVFLSACAVVFSAEVASELALERSEAQSASSPRRTASSAPGGWLSRHR